MKGALQKRWLKNEISFIPASNTNIKAPRLTLGRDRRRSALELQNSFPTSCWKSGRSWGGPKRKIALVPKCQPTVTPVNYVLYMTLSAAICAMGCRVLAALKRMGSIAWGFSTVWLWHPDSWDVLIAALELWEPEEDGLQRRRFCVMSGRIARVGDILGE